MTGEKAETQPITIYPADRAIVEAVQNRNGSGFSGAIRFIIREWARLSGVNEVVDESISQPAPRMVRPRASKRIRARRLSEIPGVTRGTKLN